MSAHFHNKAHHHSPPFTQRNHQAQNRLSQTNHVPKSNVVSQPIPFRFGNIYEMMLLFLLLLFVSYHIVVVVVVVYSASSSSDGDGWWWWC